MQKSSYIAFFSVVVYVILTTASFAFYLLVIDPLSGIFMITLTAPWSLLFSFIMVGLNTGGLLSLPSEIIIYISFAFLNAILIYYLASKEAKSFKEAVIEGPTNYYRDPADKEPVDVLHGGSVGRVLRSRYFNKTKYYCIKLPDGRKGYVKSEGGIKVVKKSQ